MSIQLIVYPQEFNGLNPMSGSGTQVLVDGINYTTLNTSSSTTNVAGTMFTIPQNFIDTFGTFNINTWHRFSGSSTLVTVASSTLTFISGTGILQRLSNLSQGVTYDASIDVGFNAAGIFIKHFSGTTEVTSFFFQAGNTGVQTMPFVANSATDTIVFYSVGAAFAGSASVVQTSTGVTVSSLSNGQEILDLYEDEDIPLTLSVDEFKNAAEQVKSYSKAFMLPGTKKNNKIFDNLFEITRADDGSIFNPYVKTQCTLKQDGFVLFEGYLRLIDIQDKQGEVSYNINLYSEVIALADVLGDRTFSQLNLTELDHTYNKTNIKNSWNDSGTGISYTNASTSGFRDANDTVKYPFCNWTNEWLISNRSTGTNAALDMPELTSFEQAFRPFIQIKYLIDRIFAQPDFPFSYTSAFFNTTDFKKLYMDFNWGSAQIPMVFNNNSTGRLPLMTISAGTYTMPFSDITGSNFGFDDSTNIFTAIQDNQIYNVTYYMHLQNTGLGTENVTVDIEWVANIGGVETIFDPMNYATIPLIGVVYSGVFGVVLNTGDTLRCRLTVSNTFPLFIFDQLALQLSTSANNTTSDSLLQNLRGEIEQWQFLKGLIKMFNLVTVPDKSDPNNILIEPYSDMFLENADTSELNWTDKVDIEEIKLTPLTDLKKNTIFKFVEDDDDFAFENYKQQVGGHLYGSQLFDAQISTNGLQTILTAEEEIIAEPFAATVPKPLASQYPELVVPAIYSYNAEDDTSQAFDNSPRIMYNVGKKDLVNMTYYIPTQNGTSSENSEAFLQFAHLTDIPTVVSNPPVDTDTRDFNFGVCQLIPPIGDPTPNNLFNTYWLPYFNELYNANTRTMTLKVNLGAGDINTFKFYDVVMIKNRKFRVNKIDYKPNNLSTVEFILIP
tara:strand:+ start:147 stop:2825 length:2679 start_codon:yes stop_codon:yes gene_type:complete